MLARSARGLLSAEELAGAAWPAAAGKTIARRTRVIGMVRSRLVIEVDDPLWQRNLHGFRNQLLRNLKELLEDGAPQELEFRLGTPKRPVQSEILHAETSAPARGAAPDEADAIADPVWRYLYKASRRKATA